MTSSSSGRTLRPLVVVLAIGILAAFGLAAVPTARAAFQDLDVQPGRYTGTNLYVPGETMAITVTATPGEVYDIEILNWPPFGTRSTRATFDDETILASGQRTVTWVVPSSAEDSLWYWVAVFGPNWFENSNPAPCGVFGCAAYLFEIRGYDFAAWLDRTRYIPGDTITVSWSATLVQNGSAAPDGVGEIQAYNGGTSLLPSPQMFAASQGSFSFTLGTTVDPNRDPFVEIWFNDTTGNRRHNHVLFFDIGFLDVILNVDPIFAPEAIVTIDVWAKAAGSPGGAGLASPGVAGALVNVTISDVATGAPTAYNAVNLPTDADGHAAHVFRLASTPTQAVYDVQVRVTAHGTLSASDSDTFEVRSTPRLLVQLALDRTEYVSGEAAHAIATTDPAGTANYSYAWRVADADTGSVLFQQSTGSPKLDYPIAANFTGQLAFTVTVNDGQGNSESASATVRVEYGYLTVTLDRTLFDAGDVISGSVNLRSIVITNPQYFFEVSDDLGNLVDSGNVSGTTFSFPTSDPSSDSYTFLVTASEGGRAVQGSATAVQAAMFFLSVWTDRTSYLPGETMRISYAITGRGPVAWPSVFQLNVNLLGATSTVVTTTSRSGEFALRIPEGANEGDLLLFVVEGSTGATALETIRVGPTNPLWWSEVAGIPTFAVILAILVALLFVAFIYLWRKVTIGGLAGPAVEKPTPPPPPAAPTRAPPTSPMSVPCRNCGTTIDLTTSKRPIEVMCPSCGETQLVQ